MNRNAIICLLILELASGFCHMALAVDPPDAERPLLARGEQELVPLASKVPVPDSIKSFEDEGKLEVPVQSQDPFQATLEKTTPGPAPAQWHYTVDVIKTSE